MITTLLELRKSKTAETNIQAQITKFETMVNKELDSVKRNLAQIEKDIKGCEDEVKTVIPNKVKRFEEQTKDIEL